MIIIRLGGLFLIGVILFVVTGCIWIGVDKILEKDSRVSRTWDKFCSVIVCISIVLMLSILLIFVPIKTTMVYSYEFPIYAIEDNTITVAKRYIAQTELKYYYLADYKGGKKTYSINSQQAYIIEDDNQQPKIEVYTETPTSTSLIIQYLYGDSNNHEYKIIVPNNSVTTDYNVDLEN